MAKYVLQMAVCRACTNGAEFVELLDELLRARGCAGILALDVEGGIHRDSLRLVNGRVLEPTDLLHVVRSFGQMEWGNFYALQTLPADIAAFDQLPVRDQIRASEYCLRVVDNTYWYLYSQLPEVQEAFSRMFPAAEKVVGELDELHYAD